MKHVRNAHPPLVLAVLVIALASTTTACRTTDDTAIAEIAVNFNPLVFPAIPLDDVEPRTLEISSVGNGTLRLDTIRIQSGGEAFSIAEQDLPITLEPGESHRLTVTHTRTATTAQNGVLRVESNGGNLNVQLEAPALLATLVASPNPLSFGRVPIGTHRVRTLTVQNAGNAGVGIRSIRFDAGAGIEMATAGAANIEGAEFENFVPETPFELGTTEVFEIDFRCSPVDDRQLFGDLIITTELETQVNVQISCNGPQPCLEVQDPTGRVNERSIDFGEVAIGVDNARPITITNCGLASGEELQVTSITIEGGDEDVMGIANLDPARLPFQLAPAEADGFVLTCNPNDLDAYTASLVVRSNDEEQDPLEIPVVCIGSDNTPPIASAQCRVSTATAQTGFQDDLDTVPFVTVECTCAGSSDPDGDLIESCLWDVTKPSGATTGGEGTPNQTYSFFLDEISGSSDAGDAYQVCLTVVDDRGASSTNEECVSITATPEGELTCRLVWAHAFGGSTDPLFPDADPNQSRGCGADLDIHALSSTQGSWFDVNNAVFFSQQARTQNWPAGERGSLDVDVRLGVGPEVITVRDPSPGVTYTCAVHYWDDYGWQQYPQAGGWADATLEVYAGGALIAEYTRRMNQKAEFWEAVQITWRDPIPTSSDITSSNTVLSTHCDSPRAPSPCPARGGSRSVAPCWN
ncbi:MAG: choice-of-anchor D domain-containing protein [Deltaproteobacteria bacterium]|nr:MAG: choice-of-anchor D domain-containing protein [Deltaproteobacteria bacterium]